VLHAYVFPPARRARRLLAALGLAAAAVLAPCPPAVANVGCNLAQSVAPVVTFGPMPTGGIEQAFPQEVAFGQPMARARAFAALHPDRARLVDSTRYGYTYNGNTSYSSRPTLVISTAGLAGDEGQRFFADYLKYMSADVVSFPLSENAGHLYSRLGTKMADFLAGVRFNDVSLFGGRKLEPIVFVPGETHLRLRQYVANAVANPGAVVGGFSYAGPTSDSTPRSLEDNRPESGGHNCTSWMSMAPIGPNGQYLCEAARVGMTYGSHKGPGWWTMTLVTHSPASVVPLVVYWMDQPLAQFQPPPSGEMPWNFHL
jgi:hypothetical protein